MVDVPLLELGQLLPHPLLVLVQLKEPDMDIPLLDSLDEDEDLLLAFNAASKSTEGQERYNSRGAMELLA